MSVGQWELIESDPAIFTTLLQELGIGGLQVDELWTLDKAALDRLQPVYALIFLFRYLESHPSNRGRQAGQPVQQPPGTCWFAHQVVSNACATLAILNAVMNVHTNSPSIALGDELGRLKSFSAGLDPQTNGELIANSPKIRSVHNSFARPDPFHRDQPKASSGQDAYHFITYVPVQGELYELDGLKASPISHGRVPLEGDHRWTDLAREVIEKRINTYPPGEVHFNLMAICGNRLQVLRNRLASQGVRSNFETEELEREIQGEELKSQRWSEEIAIKRHNHIGLAHALMVALAQSDKLNNRIQIAKQAMQQRRSNE